MSDPALIVDPQTPLAAPVPAVAAGWPAVLTALAVALLGTVALYWQTAAEMAAIWWRSETFAHGLLVAPIFIWLVWRKRVALSRVPPQPCIWGLPLLLLCLLPRRPLWVLVASVLPGPVTLVLVAQFRSFLDPGLILLAIPLYVLLRNLHLLNSLTGLVLVYTTFALPFCVWMLRNYFLSIPVELDDAARVDGASRLQALFGVILPVAVPGIIATSIFAFILSWNEFLYANTFISSSNKRTVSIGLQSLIGEFTTDWGLLMAGAVVTTIPVVIVFFAVQRYLTQGLAAGAVKG